CRSATTVAIALPESRLPLKDRQRSILAAGPSSAGYLQMAAIFPVQQEPTSRPAIPQARCGIAPTLFRCDPIHPRLAESSKHIPERRLLPQAVLGNPGNSPGA